VDDTEATQLMLETLFEIRWRVREVHAVIIGEEDDGEAEEDDA
jgi:hypothetical protein